MSAGPLHPIWIIICGFFIVAVGFTLLLTFIGLVVDVIFGSMRIIPLPRRRARPAQT